jgi:hypothetical protein
VFNTNVYSGTDGTLTLSNPVGIEEEAWGNYFGEVAEVGRVTNVAISVNTAIRAFHELGSHLPRELRAGSVSIEGTIDRAYINGAMLTLMLGKASSDEEKAQLKIPSFDMKIALDNLTPEGDNGNSLLTVYGVMFDRWRFTLTQDDFVLENLAFKARRVAILDIDAG